MSAITPILCSCIICKYQTSQLGINTHYLRSHGTDEEIGIWRNSVSVKHASKSASIEKYNKSPTKCQYCGTEFNYDNRRKKYCNQSCACSHQNRLRKESGWSMPKHSRISISNKLCKPHNTHSKYNTKGEFCKVYFFKCKICSNPCSASTNKKLCDPCRSQIQRGTDLFRFQFNIYDYPDLFDLSLIEKHGWFCQGGGKRNINSAGISRDHRVSVHDAIKNNYDHYYITHPINCELMLHHINMKKGRNSSLSYTELVKLVNNYDVIRGRH